MLLTLNANSVRSMLVPQGRRKKADLALRDLPAYTREELGLHGLNIPTDILAGAATRDALTDLRERADKAGASILLLMESEALPMGAADEARAQAGVDRLLRVVQAASVLGCNSASVGVATEGAGDEAQFDRIAQRMKRVLERAERLEVNVLISPRPGLTETPEKITELIKKIGGFRVGTFPDFEAAVLSGDGPTYMRRLTPYASVVNASTRTFAEPAGEEPAPRKRKKRRDEPDEVEDREPDEAEADDEAALDLDPDASPEDRLLAAIMGGADLDEEEDDLGPVAQHVEYDLRPLVEAVTAVGYDGTLSIDYRGEGDPALGIAQSRDALEAALDAIAGG